MTSAKSVIVFLLSFSYKVIFVHQINRDDNDDDGGISNKKLGIVCIQQHFWIFPSVIFLRFFFVKNFNRNTKRRILNSPSTFETKNAISFLRTVGFRIDIISE